MQTVSSRWDEGSPEKHKDQKHHHHHPHLLLEIISCQMQPLMWQEVDLQADERIH